MVPKKYKFSTNEERGEKEMYNLGFGKREKFHWVFVLIRTHGSIIILR